MKITKKETITVEQEIHVPSFYKFEDYYFRYYERETTWSKVSGNKEEFCDRIRLNNQWLVFVVGVSASVMHEGAAQGIEITENEYMEALRTFETMVEEAASNLKAGINFVPEIEEVK